MLVRHLIPDESITVPCCSSVCIRLHGNSMKSYTEQYESCRRAHPSYRHDFSPVALPDRDFRSGTWCSIRRIETVYNILTNFIHKTCIVKATIYNISVMSQGYKYSFLVKNHWNKLVLLGIKRQGGAKFPLAYQNVRA